MQFTEVAALLRRLLIPLSMALLMVGCGAMPVSFVPHRSPTDTPEVAADSRSENTAESSQPLQRTPNPYLTSGPDVPEAARAGFARALQAIQAGDHQQAKLLLQQLCQAYPQLSGLQLNLGLVYRQLQKPELARAAFEAAIGINPNNLDAYNQLAILQRETGAFDAAEQLYLQALDIWPQHPASHRNLGILYDLYLGREKQALQHYEQYQLFLDAEDDEVNRWIQELRRRLQAQAMAADRQDF